MNIPDYEYQHLLDSKEQLEAILNLTEGIPISQNKVCELLGRGREKVRKLLGVKIRPIDNESNMYGYNMADVLRLAGKRL